MAGGVCGRRGMHGGGGGHEWQERRSLQWTVRILLECILVSISVQKYTGLLKQNRFSHCSQHTSESVAVRSKFLSFVGYKFDHIGR